mmetsp:Transcript_10039/g.25055  ORF Transcript_10039/g.25055 Transcript_10039/m.25055 type:complete len:270 (-) Transcript_10039:903-1712(-)
MPYCTSTKRKRKKKVLYLSGKQNCSPNQNPRPPSRFRGAAFTMSSTRRIISAASDADSKTWDLTLNDSSTLSCEMSPMHPLFMSRPAVESPLLWRARSCATSSSASSPPFWAMMVGIIRSARANASMATDCLPGVVAASWSTALAITISDTPAPSTTRFSFATAWEITHSASCRERSASSRPCLVEPRRMIVQASPLGTPENLIIRSSPIMNSEMSLHVPSCTFSGWSNVETISAPSTRDSRSMPSKSACSMAMIPFSVKNCSGRLYMS